MRHISTIGPIKDCCIKIEKSKGPALSKTNLGRDMMREMRAIKNRFFCALDTLEVQKKFLAGQFMALDRAHRKFVKMVKQSEKKKRT